MIRVPRSLVPALIWVAQPALIVGALWLALGGPARDARAPLEFSGEGLATLARVRAAADSASWWRAPDLGIPDADPLQAPRDAHLDQLLVRVASGFSRRVPAVVTMVWALMLVLGGASCAWCLRRLGVSTLGAWSAGVLFAWCPFALGRSPASFGVMPYLVPFAATAALRLATARQVDAGWRGWRAVFVGTAIVGFNAIYGALFAAYLAGVGAVAGCVRTRRRAHLAAGAALIGAMALAAAVTVATHTAPARNDDGPGDGRSLVADVDMSALRIRQLLSPLPGHWFGPFREWVARDERARFPEEPEAARARLGLIASAGFLGLIAILLVPSLAGAGDEGEIMRAASRLLLAVLVLAMAGGLGSLVTLLVLPDLRDYTGMMPFVAFFSLAAVALAIDRATTGWPKRRGAVWAVLLVVGLFDQSVALQRINDGRDAIHEEFVALRAFVGGLEGALPPGAKVFQLPLRPSPPDLVVVRARGYDYFKPWLVSRALRWSSPEVSADQIRWQTDLAAIDPRELPSYLAREGFAAIVVDRLGYRDRGLAMLATLQAAAASAQPLFENDRYVAIDIRKP